MMQILLNTGNTRFNVSEKSASRGSGAKAAPMKWRLDGGNGITLLLMNRDSHIILLRMRRRWLRQLHLCVKA